MLNKKCSIYTHQARFSVSGLLQHPVVADGLERAAQGLAHKG